LLHHDFRRSFDTLDELNPTGIEATQAKVGDFRQKTEAVSGREARAKQEKNCPIFSNGRHETSLVLKGVSTMLL
jgi:hypothetical protein